jgi:hypothetical protein
MKEIQSYIRVNGKQITLGTFVNKEDAAIKRDIAALKHYGEFANLNFKT